VGLALRSVALLLLLGSLPVAAQEAGFELGVRYWLSRGHHQFSHNAQGANPGFGNPTSILTYEDTEAHTLEFHGRSEVGSGWFARGNFGVGYVRDGGFDDEDYLAGQVKFSDTTSSLEGERLSYFTLDVGRRLWRNANGTLRLECFVGFQQWSETLDAFGLTATVGPTPPASITPATKVITNKVRWRSLRAGLAAHADIARATKLRIDVALIPYSDLRNEDSHHLRDDLGPTPNIITIGTGGGIQLDVELRRPVGKRVELGVGLRHWHLRSTEADVTFAGVLTLPVNEVETRRTGAIFTLSGRW
jgi:hypothetical protein